MNPSKRLGTVEEMAKGFLYLASDASKYMVGSEPVLDGGVKPLKYNYRQTELIRLKKNKDEKSGNYPGY